MLTIFVPLRRVAARVTTATEAPKDQEYDRWLTRYGNGGEYGRKSVDDGDGECSRSDECPWYRIKTGADNLETAIVTPTIAPPAASVPTITPTVATVSDSHSAIPPTCLGFIEHKTRPCLSHRRYVAADSAASDRIGRDAASCTIARWRIRERYQQPPASAH